MSLSNIDKGFTILQKKKRKKKAFWLSRYGLKQDLALCVGKCHLGEIFS